MDCIFEEGYFRWEVVGLVVGLIVINRCIKDTIFLDFLHFGFRYPLYKVVVVRVCGLLFAVVEVNNILQVHSILFNSIFNGTILWMIHMNTSLILCFKNSFSTFYIFLLHVWSNVHLFLLLFLSIFSIYLVFVRELYHLSYIHTLGWLRFHYITFDVIFTFIWKPFLD